MNIHQLQPPPSPRKGERGGGGVRGLTHRIACLALLVLALASCTRFTQDPDPTPTGPISQVLPTLRLRWTDSTQLTVNFDSLVTDKTQPYTARFTQPAQGTIRLEGSVLRYQPTQTGWQRDSCTYTLCQGTACGTGWLVFLNPAHVAACTQLPLIRLYSTSGQSHELQIIPTGQPGRLVDWQAEHFTTDTVEGSEGRRLAYVAAGGGDSSNWGFDRVTYRWEYGILCYEGVIEVAIGDTCNPHARNFSLATAGTAFVRADTLAGRARGCRGQVADGIFYLQGRALRRETLYGEVSDTTIGGVRGLYYRRVVVGSEPDIIDYYYIHTSDFSNRITRATIRLTF